ncbi:hypothetical protein PSPO01_03244 [Paraphaeosphaeria sporulosa]
MDRLYHAHGRCASLSGTVHRGGRGSMLCVDAIAPRNFRQGRSDVRWRCRVRASFMENPYTAPQQRFKICKTSASSSKRARRVSREKFSGKYLEGSQNGVGCLARKGSPVMLMSFRHRHLCRCEQTEQCTPVAHRRPDDGRRLSSRARVRHTGSG